MSGIHKVKSNRRFHTFYAAMLNGEANKQLRRLFIDFDPANSPDKDYYTCFNLFLSQLDRETMKKCIASFLVTFPKFTPNFNLEHTKYLMKFNIIDKHKFNNFYWQA